MTLLLSIVCVQQVGQLDLPTTPISIEEKSPDRQGQPRLFPHHAVGSLIIEEAHQAPGSAAYLDGLSQYFGRSVEGKAYFILVNIGDFYHTGEPFLTSEALFTIPANGNERIRLTIGDEYRSAFETILRGMLKSSAEKKLLVLCEWNGNVTSVNERTEEELTSFPVLIHGPVNITGFWRLHDGDQIKEGSITIIKEEMTGG